MESERLAGSHSEPSKPVSGKGFSLTAAPCLPQPCPTRGTRHRPGTLDPLGVHLKGAQSLSAQSLLQPPNPHPRPNSLGEEAHTGHLQQGQTYGNELGSVYIQVPHSPKARECHLLDEFWGYETIKIPASP